MPTLSAVTSRYTHTPLSIKKRYLKNAPPFGRAAFKKQGDMVTNALGTHTYRMQGKTRKHDLAINSDLLCAPEELLKALVVHELAHFKRKRPQQKLLSVMLPHGAAVSSARIRFTDILCVSHAREKPIFKVTVIT